MAVAPELKRQGPGRWLLQFAAARGREQNAALLRLDTAMPATHLIALYESEGFSIVDEVQWGGKAYKSVIMEKLLQ
ncbi:MAG: hypothetical protein DDT20_00145 [Firmicutes bacterium]|nr:hypothetical protein [Bacillota bacterium]